MANAFDLPLEATAQIFNEEFNIAARLPRTSFTSEEMYAKTSPKGS